jgi:hypothetical protein
MFWNLFDRALRRFLFDKTSGHVFYGVKDAACSKVTLRIKWFTDRLGGPEFRARVGDKFSFVYTFDSANVMTEVSLPEKERVDLVKAETNSKHAAQTERNRRRNHNDFKK